MIKNANNYKNKHAQKILDECIVKPTDLFHLLIQANSLQILEKLTNKKNCDIWEIKKYPQITWNKFVYFVIVNIIFCFFFYSIFYF